MLFYAGSICGTKFAIRVQLQSMKYLVREEKEQFGEGLQSLLRSNAKPLPLTQSVKFKCNIWSKITKEFAKKCLDATSLGHSRNKKCLDASSRA